jgi:hypothetical protein
MSTSPSRSRRRLAAVALVAAGVAGGGVLASTMSASAADSPSAAASSAPGYGQPSTTVDESRSQRSDEHLLTGTDAEKARAAALAAYPGATVQRVETDSDGVYEAHVVTADGTRLIVQMDASFAVTGTDTGGGGGDHDGDGPAAPPAG